MGVIELSKGVNVLILSGAGVPKARERSRTSKVASGKDVKWLFSPACPLWTQAMTPQWPWAHQTSRSWVLISLPTKKKQGGTQWTGWAQGSGWWGRVSLEHLVPEIRLWSRNDRLSQKATGASLKELPPAISEHQNKLMVVTIRTHWIK